MNEMFKKLLMKKKGMDGEMSDGRQKARGSVLDDLMSNMDARDGNKLGMKKVSVLAPSEDGLKEGLDKAKEIVGKEGSPEEEKLESPEEEMSEDESQPDELAEDHSGKTPEQLMEEIKQLKAALAAKA